MSWSSASASTPYANASLARALSSDCRSSVSPGSILLRRKRSPSVTLNGLAKATAFFTMSCVFIYPPFLYLPAAAQCFVHLHDRQQFISTRRREASLSVKQISIGVECFKECCHAPVVTQISEPASIANRVYQQLSLGAD